MELSASVQPDILGRIQASSTCAEILELMPAEGFIRFISEHHKEPCARKTVMLLAAPAADEPDDARVRRLSAFGALWSDKRLHPLVKEYAAKAFQSRPHVLPSQLTREEKLNIALFLSGKSFNWLNDFAATAVVSERHDKELLTGYIKILIERSSTLAGALSEIDASFSRDADLLKPATYESATALLNILECFSSAASKAACPPGIDFGLKLFKFTSEITQSISAFIKPEEGEHLGVGIASMILDLSIKQPNLLTDESVFNTIKLLTGELVSVKNKKWEKIRKQLSEILTNLITTAAIYGSLPDSLISRLSYLDPGKLTIEKLCKNILSGWEISSESARAALKQLSQGGGDVAAAENNSQTNMQSLASVVLRADELSLLISEINDSNVRGVAESLVAEVRQAAKRFSLAVDHQRGALVAYDPSRQRLVSGEPGAQVRVISPGILKSDESGRSVQLIPAIVQPA